MTFVDTRLLVAAGSVWFAQYLTLVQSWQVGLAAVLAGGCSLVAWFARQQQRVRPGLMARALLALMLCGFAGVAVAFLRAQPLIAQPLPTLIGDHAVVYATVQLSEPPRVSHQRAESLAPNAVNPFTWSAKATMLRVDEGASAWAFSLPITILGNTADPATVAHLVPGTVIRFRSVVASPESRFGIAAVMRMRGTWQLVEPAPGWQDLAAKIRRDLARSVQPIAADPRGLLPGLVAGDESQLDATLRDDMRATGLSHLTAVSGSNVAIVAGMVLFAARGLRVPKVPAAALAALTLVGYVAIVGAQPSVLRATAMGMLALLAIALSREKHGLSLVATSVLILLLVDPWLSVSAGFALSVVATVALLLCAKPRGGTPFRRIVYGALLASSAAGIATLPIVAALGNGIPIYTVATNMAAMVAVPLATGLGFLALVLSQVSPGLAEVVGTAAGYPTGWIAFVARSGARLPCALLAWPQGIAGFALALAAIGFGMCGVVLFRRASRQTQIFLVRAAAVAIVVIFLSTRLSGTSRWVQSDWAFVACSVGQGDALVFNAGQGAAVVIDVGPSSAEVDRCLTDLGITSIPLLVLSHFHADHVDGLAGALTGRDIGRVIASPLSEPQAQAIAVADILGKHDMHAEAAHLGEVGSVGRVEYEIVWPAARGAADESAPNNASVVMRITVSGLRVLVTGDLEPSTQAQLLRRINVADFDVVKVPHHGSRYQSPDLATRASSATLAIVSVGVGNRYGHPADSTIAAWRNIGATVLRTDTDGDIAAWSDQAGGVRFVIRGSHEGKP